MRGEYPIVIMTCPCIDHKSAFDTIGLAVEALPLWEQGLIVVELQETIAHQEDEIETPRADNMFLRNQLARYRHAVGDLDANVAWDVFDISQFPLQRLILHRERVTM